jgi:hypothetical protein
MNITFNTAGGKPPYTIYIGFENWFATMISLPATYADSDVSTWLYQFPVPYFNPTATSPPNPHTIVTVGDSTGALLNSSEFKQVQSLRSDCAWEAGNLNFTFWTDNNPSAVCSDVDLHWSPWSNTSTWTDPLNLYVVPAQMPPIHIPVTNSTLGSMNFTLRLEPGTFFSLTMTDAHGSGGVSGYNLAGIDEYVNTDCLSQPDPYAFAMPSPTATIAASVRMPYFSGTVSSLVTSNGVVSTATSIEVVKNGSVLGPNLKTAQIVGMAVGIAIAAAVLAALISWCVWRKRHGHRTTFWDVPKGMDGELGKEDLSAPIDRNFLKAYGSQQTSSIGSSSRPMLAQTSVRSDSEEEHERGALPVASNASFVDSPHRNSTPPYDTLSSVRRGSGGPQTTNNTNSVGSSWSAAHRYVSLPTIDGISLPGSPPSTANSTSRQRSGSLVEVAQAVARWGTVHSGAPNSSARSYNIHGADFDETDSRHSTADITQSHAVMESNILHAGSSSRRSLPSNRMTPTHSQSGGTMSAEHHASRVPQVVQHRDAGLIMDDSLDDAELMGRVELPPSYHQIERPGLRDTTRSSLRNSFSANSESGNQPTSTNVQTQAPLVEAEDESEFWRTPASD